MKRKRGADCLQVKKTEVKWKDFSLWVAAGLKCSKCSILCPQNESVTYQIVSTLRDQTKLPQLASNTLMSHAPVPAAHVGGTFRVVCTDGLWMYETQIF